MLILVLGLVLFLGVHLVPTAPDVRAGLAARYGEAAFKIGFSILSLIGFALIVIGYHKLQVMTGKNVQLWSPPDWTKHVAFLLMWPALIFLVAAYVPSRIRTALKHPMLVAIKTWALAHLIANGDLASLLLFGSFLAYAVYDRISVKRRGAPGPLGHAVGSAKGDVIVVLVGTALYAFMLFLGHGLLIGVPLVSTSFAP